MSDMKCRHCQIRKANQRIRGLCFTCHGNKDVRELYPQRKHGPKPSDPMKRFWAKVCKGENCWEWTGRLVQGYGSFYPGGDRLGGMVRAHRFIYEQHFGKIADTALQVCHRCDNPRCVRPEHLFLGTNQDNVADMVSKGRQARGEKMRNTKLTPDIVRLIRLRVANGEQKKAVARSLGISETSVRNVAKRKRWAHV